METSFLNSEFIKTHLQNNASCVDYNDFIRDCFDFEGLKVIINDNVFKKSHLIKIIEQNTILAKSRIQSRLKLREPLNGDFIKINDEYFRIAMNVGENEFQYCIDGSFFIGKEGGVSYSGGFEFKHGSRFNFNQLKRTFELKKGWFWFFSQDSAGGSKGVHFLEDFRVWEISPKEQIN